ncbi:MAG TPA: hypothetical protein VE760_07015 [Acidimicrobiales bacterium]|nr:hypothetical protein [Acidimicrobiales bacterium]
MQGTGFLARVSGLRAGAKVGVAAIAAALTMTAAVAAAVVLPAGGGDSGSDVMHSATVDGGASVDAGTSTTSATTEVQTDAGASASTSAGSAPNTANVGAHGGAAVANSSTPLPSIPIPSIPASVPVPGGALPDLSTLTDIPAKVMACLAPVFELVSSMPAVPSPQQLTQIGPSIVSCVTGIVADLPLPFGMNACISEIMGFVSDVTSNLPNGLPDFGDLDVAACIPSGLPAPTGLSAWSSFMGGGFPFGR